eukprot:m.514179 g.514179  ORF g.514179 m.514179 type:complete len:72 (-) comp21911_c1_seq18:180-395(-)
MQRVQPPQNRDASCNNVYVGCTATIMCADIVSQCTPSHGTARVCAPRSIVDTISTPPLTLSTKRLYTNFRY